MKQWEIDGLKQQTEYLGKIADRFDVGKPVSGSDRRMYRELTGDIDYSDADAGMEKEIRHKD